MFSGNKFIYHSIKISNTGDDLQKRLEKLRRAKSQSLFLLVFFLLVMYIILNVFLPDSYTWFSYYSYYSNYKGNNSLVRSILNDHNYRTEQLNATSNTSTANSSSPPSFTFLRTNDIYTTEISRNASSVAFLTMTSAPSTFSEFYDTSLATGNVPEFSTQLPQENVACKIPVLDPFNKSIKHLIKSLSDVEIDCKAKFPLLFTSFSNLSIVPLTDAIEEEGYNSCCYRKILRNKKSKTPDKGFRKSSKCYPVSLQNATTVKEPDEEFIAIYCKQSVNHVSNWTKNGGNFTNNNTTTVLINKYNNNFTIEKHSKLTFEKTDSGKMTTPNYSTSHNSTSFSNKTLDKSFIKKKVVDMHVMVHLKATVEKRIQEYYKHIRQNNTDTQKSKKGSKIISSQYGIPSKESERVNILIFGIDAVSHMNFLRTMPKSHSFLVNNLSAIEMHGFNKIGDNTFPNIASMLTRLNVSEMKTCEKKGFYDECPFIWKEYAMNGYRTSYGEDSTWMGIFNYLKNGFRKSPTDYYLRPFGEAAEKLIATNKKLNAKQCYGPRLSFQVLLDYVEKFAFKMGLDKRYFQFIWATSLTHDYLNDAMMGDKHLYKTLQWMSQGGYFNNTVLILMSDHGIRWGPIRKYLQGQVEERLPFAYFVLPDWFKVKYSRAYENLKNNQNRLTTPYDFHETLVDLLYLYSLDLEAIRIREEKLTELIRQQKAIPKGISQFLPIPASRTCQMAGVVEHYCTCHKSSFLPVEHPMVQQAANYIIYHINFMISQYSECAFLSLQAIRRALLITSEMSGLKAYQLVVETRPGGGVFESLVEKNKKGFWMVSGSISRTNLYGNQSHCITKKEMKLYCYCLDMIKNNTVI